MTSVEATVFTVGKLIVIDPWCWPAEMLSDAPDSLKDESAQVGVTANP